MPVFPHTNTDYFYLFPVTAKPPVEVGFLGSQDELLEKVLQAEETHVELIIHTRKLQTAAQSDTVHINEKDCTDELISKHISKCDPDLIIVAGLPTILSKQTISKAPPIYNIHYSLLPTYRGRHPIESAFINGEEFFGVTIHELSPEMDAGDIILQQRIRMLDGDTHKSLRRKSKAIARILIDDFIDGFISNSISTVSQNEQTASYFPPREPADSRIDWSMASRLICRQVQVSTDEYPAFTETEQGEATIDECYKFDDYRDDLTNILPGQVVESLIDSFIVSTGSGAVLAANSEKSPQDLGISTESKLL